MNLRINKLPQPTAETDEYIILAIRKADAACLDAGLKTFGNIENPEAFMRHLRNAMLYLRRAELDKQLGLFPDQLLAHLRLAATAAGEFEEFS